MKISGKDSVTTVEAASTPEATTPSGLERNSSSLSEFVSENTIIPMAEADYNSVVRIHPLIPSETTDSKVWGIQAEEIDFLKNKNVVRCFNMDNNGG